LLFERLKLPDRPSIISRSPVAAGAAATGAAAAESTEAAALVIIVSTTTAAASTKKHAEEKADESRPASARYKEEDQQENDTDDEQLAQGERFRVLTSGRTAQWRLQSDTCIRSYFVGDLGHGEENGSVVASLFQVRHHGSADLACLLVGDDAFQSVANFNPALPVLRGQDDQDAAVILFGADAPLFFELIGKICDRHILEGLDGNDCNLRMCLVINLGAELVKGSRGLWRKHTGKIAYVILRTREILDSFCTSAHPIREDEEANGEIPPENMTHAISLDGFAAPGTVTADQEIFMPLAMSWIICR
jgi:hypothetical protein